MAFILYSDDYPLSKNSEVITLNVNEVEDRFGFLLINNTLKSSIDEGLAFVKENNAGISYNILNSLPLLHNYEKNLVLHKVSQEVGYGVSTLNKIPHHTILLEYAGERVGYLEPFIKDAIYGYATHQSPIISFLDAAGLIDQESYDLYANTSSLIVLKDYGNIGRFFNDCPPPPTNVLSANVGMIQVPVSVEPLLIKAYLVTTRDIKEFEPLCWEYGENYEFQKRIVFDAQTYLPITGASEILHDEL